MRYAEVLQIGRNIRIALHKIPSHLDSKSMGRYNIPKNTEADEAAKQARDTPQEFSSVNCTRQQTLRMCADLLTKISNLLISAHGPSSDRLSSSAVANLDSEISDPETHPTLA